MLSTLVGLAVCLTSVLAQTNSSSAAPPSYTIQAENITAVLTPYGARLVSLLVPDQNGVMQDVVVGYDDTEQYIKDSETNHTFFGAVVGRYANRIKNGTFTIDGETYHIPENENGGRDTLHGGTVGYDQRNWTVLSTNDSSIAMALLDEGFEGFPGNVLTVATYAVSVERTGPQGQMRPRLTTQLVSSALDQKTPIMLANHIYWSLNAFKADTILNDTTLWMPYCDRYIQTDGILVPNGTIAPVSTHPAIDFTSPKLFGTAIDATAGQGYCGTGCTGIDNAFTIDRPADIGITSVVPVLYAWSNATGIELTVSTNEQGLQIYTCNGQNGTIPVRESQQQRNNGTQGAAEYVQKHGCFVIETQVYIDAINNPGWGVDRYEIFSPQTPPAVNFATYDFSIVGS